MAANETSRWPSTRYVLDDEAGLVGWSKLDHHSVRLIMATPFSPSQLMRWSSWQVDSSDEVYCIVGSWVGRKDVGKPSAWRGCWFMDALSLWQGVVKEVSQMTSLRMETYSWWR